MRRALIATMALAATLCPAPAPAQQTQLPPGTTVQDPANAPANNPLPAAETKLDQRDFDGARTLLQPYLQQHPADARALFDLGYAEQATGHADLATASYTKAIAADPRQFESRLALGLLQAKAGDSAAAQKNLQAATQLNPATPNPAAKAQAWRALAALDRPSDPAAAKNALLEALKLTPETEDDLLLTAGIAEASNDTESAEAAYRRVLAANPGSSPATAGLAHSLLQQKKYTDAEPLLRIALARDPDDVALNAQLATTLIAEDKGDAALPVLEKLQQLQPNEPNVQQMLADAYSQSGHPDKADPLYAQVLQARPDDPDALTGRGHNLMLQRRYAEAAEVFQHAARVKPDDGDAWSGLAFAASETGQYSAALQALTMRSKYLPDTPATYFLAATSYDNLHQTTQAVEYYRLFLSAASGRFPDQEWQARHRLVALGRSH